MTENPGNNVRLEARVAELEESLNNARLWMNVMYQDMLRLQHASAKAMSGDRDAANDIYLSVQRNAKALSSGGSDE